MASYPGDKGVTDGQTDGQTDRRTDGPTDRWIEVTTKIGQFKTKMTLKAKVLGHVYQLKCQNDLQRQGQSRPFSANIQTYRGDDNSASALKAEG